MSTYRLLRNNKEAGPFTREQLIGMGLKAYDLVWVDGKSAAWRYPSEIPELAAYAPAVEEQPFDRFYRRSPAPAQPAPKSKPRFRIKADWRKVEDAPVVPQSSAPADVPPAAPLYNQAATADEATVAPLRNPAPPAVQPQASPAVSTPVTNNNATTPSAAATAADTRVIPETRYSESLDSIKERYSNTVLQRNTTRKGNMLRYAAVVGLFPVLAAGIWIGTSWSNRNKLENVPAETAATVTGVPQSSAPASATADGSSPETAPVEETAPVHTLERSETPGNGQPAQEETTPAPPPRQIMVKNEAKPVQPSKNNNRVGQAAATVNTPLVRTAVNKTTMPAAQSTVLRPVAENKQPAIVNTPAPAPSQAYENTATASKNKINDYVAVKEEYEQVNENSRQVKLRVHNKSSIPLDLVVVDLQYYDASGRFKKGETLYVNNLSARDEITLDAPAAQNNQRVNYKVSLLSIEKKGIYLIAE
ncbi:hypothetical protein HNQ91_003236 [Filimonas zeae]|nr:hypothetical protein [Filimonas zeae]MDR6340171.1 hypothetical protein [Filimonas zeae]